MWKVMICDDEQAVCTAVRAQLERFARECGASFSVQECHSGEQLLCRLTPDVDLVFLDIRMEGISGMEAARRLRERNRSACLIFLTSMTQYAMEGYRVHAYGFLKKPVSYAQFRLQMLDTVRHLESRAEETFTLKAGGEVYMLYLNRVLYVEVRDHAVCVVQKGGKLSCYGTMSEMEHHLVKRGFFRCHKSYMVNLRNIDQITGTAICLSGGTEIPLSKHRKQEFMEAFAAFAGGGLL